MNNSQDVQRPEVRSLVVLVVVSCLVIILLGSAIVWLLNGVDKEGIRVGLNNVATVGGIASGLSLSGTAVLSLKGQVIQNIVQDYGHFVRTLIFGGYACMVVAAMTCGLFAAKPEHPAAMWVIGYSASVIVVGLLLTAFMINGLFGKQHISEVTGITRSPVVLPRR
jgi:hypothetical protein